VLPRGKRYFGRRACCQQQIRILQQKDVLGLSYTKELFREGKKNQVNLKASHHFEISQSR